MVVLNSHLTYESNMFAMNLAILVRSDLVYQLLLSLFILFWNAIYILMYDSRIPFALHVCKTIVLPVTATLNSKCRILRHIHPHICNSLEWGPKMIIDTLSRPLVWVKILVILGMAYNLWPLFCTRIYLQSN